ncbi:esterase-like activity of phytase family protein [Georgenia sp. EYE_87]|uniref:esterase-like activity of phytase family protein n=1 Tax=Georgenia sp. EYE_87 TaxID=2853448 RepID=UPI002005F88D|nr:esterase-like activity of phytase family protein [Georgenia sp. EYE_87]MCK6212242.1 esterase-like activity of phytase family protein [Georgenia sp. EYE_87]
MRTTIAAAALTAASVLTLPMVAAAAPAPASPAAGAAASDQGRGPHLVPTLEQRATLSADHLAEGPASGAAVTPANGRTGPFDGQVIPGFSAMVDNGDGSFWAMPDNGFGNKQNSGDFLLRVYRVTPDWETVDGGAGEIAVEEFISLSDPDGHIDFPIVNDGTQERLLTGNDFDIESLVRAEDGSFWIGEEFGPFLLHVDATGKLLEAPVPLPDLRAGAYGALESPQSPYLDGEEPLIRSSKGFEAMAGSKDGRYLYPVLEGAITDDDQQRRRWIFQFDTTTGDYTDRTWQYEADTDANLVGDAFLVKNDRLLILERDDFDGPASVTKRVYEIDLSETDDAGYVEKELVIDLLDIANPDGIGTATSRGAYGVGEDFTFPMQSVEVVLQLADGRLLIANDNNYPGNDARYPGTPDDTEMIVLDLEPTNRGGRGAQAGPNDPVEVIGHRGASGYRPEHTLAAYELAMNQCVDFIEPDLVATKDGVLVARHENEIGGTTDVADHPEFADRRTTKTIDGAELTGWFTEDFTLAELRTLRAKERIPGTRPASTAFDGLYVIPTFEEVVDLARHSRTCDGEPMGIAPEIKHPTYFDSIGLSMEEGVAEILAANGYGDKQDPVVIQSFETANLRDLDGLTDVALAQLINCSGAPYDLVAAGDPRTYADLATAEGLKEIAGYADVLGACKDVMIPRDADGRLAAPSPVIADAHRAGLEVHGWTFRAENTFLPTEFRSSTDPAAHGDLAGEIAVFLEAGMDGLFSDHPDIAVAAAEDFVAAQHPGRG